MTTKYSYSERAIANATGSLYKGTVDGKVAWTNAEMLEIGIDNPFKRLKQAVVWDDRKPNFQTLVDNNKKRVEITATGATPFEVERRRDNPPYGMQKIKCILLSAKKCKTSIQENYYNFFNARYPDCLFGIAEFSPTISVVTIYDNKHNLIGLVMPIFTAEANARS